MATALEQLETARANVLAQIAARVVTLERVAELADSARKRLARLDYTNLRVLHANGARGWAELPATTVKYVRRIEELIGAPVTLLSTSPERDDTILVKDPFSI